MKRKPDPITYAQAHARRKYETALAALRQTKAELQAARDDRDTAQAAAEIARNDRAAAIVNAQHVIDELRAGLRAVIAERDTARRTADAATATTRHLLGALGAALDLNGMRDFYNPPRDLAAIEAEINLRTGEQA